jgi:putative transposase
MERYRRGREASLPRAGEGLDPVVREWIDRPIGTYPFLIVNAVVIKIRKGDRVRSQSVLMATG